LKEVLINSSVQLTLLEGKMERKRSWSSMSLKIYTSAPFCALLLFISNFTSCGKSWHITYFVTESMFIKCLYLFPGSNEFCGEGCPGNQCCGTTLFGSTKKCHYPFTLIFNCDVCSCESGFCNKFTKICNDYEVPDSWRRLRFLSALRS